MRKWRAFWVVLFLVVVMFLLSFLLTITASRLLPPKRRPSKAEHLVLTRSEVEGSSFQVQHQRLMADRSRPITCL
ncbi:MAG TPA: hypothetical protein VM163_05130 [bacterium]|nr:hypothetical protein [bacterium]